jgi:hypothetical protein
MNTPSRHTLGAASTRTLTLAEAQAEMHSHPATQTARKRPTVVQVRFATQAETVATLEGPVQAQVGDAILTGIRGEHWPVGAAAFTSKYEPLPPTQAGENGSYRSQPRTVRALALAQATQVHINTRGDTLTGQAGDWLLDYADGSLGVVAADVFERTYEVGVG